MTKVAICYWADPWAALPSGIDSFIKGMMKYAPEDLEYTLLGASADTLVRPLSRPFIASLGNSSVRCTPLISLESHTRPGLLPNAIKYTSALGYHLALGKLSEFDVFDFHRIEPTLLFTFGRAKKNIVIHQDMANLASEHSDIGWRMAPGLYNNLERYALRRLDKIYCVRRSAVDRYLDSDDDLAGRVAFTPTWVDSEIFYGDPRDGKDRMAVALTREQLGIDPDRRMLVSVGRLDKQKDPLLLIDAFNRLVRQGHDLQLLVVGDGVLKQEVETRVSELGLEERVTFMGILPAEEIADILRCADLFLLSSAYEGMPIAVLEALACGCPVVCTDVGEVRLVVTNQVNGQIAQSRSPEHLSDAVNSVLKNLEQLSGRACIDAVEQYKPEVVLEPMYENHRRQGAD